jgi:hypothetical protein
MGNFNERGEIVRRNTSLSSSSSSSSNGGCALLLFFVFAGIGTALTFLV